MSENKRGHGGTNPMKVYPCNICGAGFESYGAQKRHLSRAHGKSTAGYDKHLRDEFEKKGS